MLYDKPWYRPGYFIGVLIACLYVDLRDPDSKGVKKFRPAVLAVFWAVLLVLFVYSSVGSWENTYEKYGPKTNCHHCDHCNNGGPGQHCDHYMGSTTTCAWSPTWDLLFSSFFRTAWCVSMGMLLWLALAGQGGPIIAALSVSFWTPIARLTFGVYLTHIMLIRLLYNTTERSFNYEDYLGAWTSRLTIESLALRKVCGCAGATMTTSNYVLSLLCSFAVYMLVEKPCANLVMMLLAPPRRRRPTEAGS